MALTTDEAVVRSGRALLGFMSEAEAQQFLASQAVDQLHEIRETWEAARAAHDALPAFDGVPPTLADLPDEVAHELAEVAATELFKQHFGHTSPDFKLVEIDRLVAFQQFVDTDFSDAAKTALGSSTVLDQVRFCLPRDFQARFSVIPVGEPGSFSLTITSLSRNVNVAGVQFGQASPDAPFAVTFPIVARANWVQVTEFEGRLFLKNGYHRVWALRSQGVLAVPAIVTKGTSLEDVGAGPGFFPPTLILSERPPLFRHFSESALAPALRLKSTMKVIRLTAEEFVLPRLP